MNRRTSWETFISAAAALTDLAKVSNAVPKFLAALIPSPARSLSSSVFNSSNSSERPPRTNLNPKNAAVVTINVVPTLASVAARPPKGLARIAIVHAIVARVAALMAPAMNRIPLAIDALAMNANPTPTAPMKETMLTRFLRRNSIVFATPRMPLMTSFEIPEISLNALPKRRDWLARLFIEPWKLLTLSNAASPKVVSKAMASLGRKSSARTSPAFNILPSWDVETPIASAAILKAPGRRSPN